MVAPTPVRFHSVPESSAFLDLFPHRFDYLYADHCGPGQKPNWKTQNRHALSDRLIQQGRYLYGVRFGHYTRYALIDLDAFSIYHPRRDPLAIQRIIAALEPVGIVAALATTSSYSEGIHLYLPFEQPQKSWQVAEAIATLLERAGFVLEPGQLEIFPNRKAYDPDSSTLYQGHRLPLQAGSYLLTDQLDLSTASPQSFVSRWQFCMSKNDVHEKALRRTIRSAPRHHHRLSSRASKFLNDLNACIDVGWTGPGQTNFILGRIALRVYCFGHLITGCEPYEGDRLTLAILQTAQSLPGYSEWCRHQHEIFSRCEEWARCVEASRYWHYKAGKPPTDADADATAKIDELQIAAPNTWNTFQERRARGRIQFAINNWINDGALPARALERFERLVRESGVSGQTLYRHRDLWHPDCLWNTPPAPPPIGLASSSPIAEGMGEGVSAPSLLAPIGCNADTVADYRRFLRELYQETGCNVPTNEDHSDQTSKNEAGSG